ncbi:NADPH-dependent diflavin oxidoreductase 1-like [Teratosphaeria destructans]|uniref:NADPH-dependent diflavin oxidoreductase 1 n=1 Tax=Teratosphaeria destructans TaxID=418781 RepID=A0A9W7W6J8_9PEZI|nr:NADPH-dependent diflavin oxidoreductase 1-like [Teratosphaeria destructans]
MERVDHAETATKGTRSSTKDNSRTTLVLYGSETGNAQDVAEEVGRLTERLRFDTTVLDLDSITLRDLVKATVVIIVISTTGQGDFPQNARRFWRTLLSGALKPGLLRKVRFSCFGLGDSSYVRFNTAQRMLRGRLLQLGAKEVCERGEGNEQHPEGHSAAFREWIVALKERLTAAFPLPEGVEIIGEDVFLEPKWKLEVATTSASGTYANGLNRSPSGVTDETPPSAALLPVISSYTADLVRNDRVTAADHFQDVRLLDLRIKESYTYDPGAVAVLYPKNFPKDVEEFIDLMKWRDVADQPLRLIQSSRAMAGSSTSNPSPLRHLNLDRTSLTLRWLLENVLDIMSIPRRSFFASLSHFAGTETEDERYQKERLLELANPELIDELWDYTTRPKRTILEVMMDFTTIRIPWQYVLSVLPTMKGRQFSIASGGKLKRDEGGNTRVQLLVAIADPPSPIIKWRRRYGVCTRYVARLEAGQQLNVGLQQGYLDVQPSEVEVPVIMIGPGTGVAPMRSLIHQRLAWAGDTGLRPSGSRLHGDMLLFGCRAETSDYFFRDEWAMLTNAEALTVHTAFSRSETQPKQYVQDILRLNGKQVYGLLHEKNGKVYVCGSSGNMPKSVREALLDVLTEYGQRTSREEAEAYLDRMEKEGRYKQETW